MSKPMIKNLYKESLIIGLSFCAFTIITLMAFFLFSYKGKCVVIDQKKEYFVFQDDLNRRVREMDSQQLEIKNRVNESHILYIPIFSLAAGHLNGYDKSKIEREFGRGFFEEMNVFYRGEGSKPIAEIDSNKVYFDHETVEEILLKQEHLCYLAPKDARIKLIDKKVYVEKGRHGIRLDMPDLVQKVQDALEQGNFDQIVVDSEKISPQIKAKDISPYKVIKSKKTLKLTEEELQNIALVEGILDRINNIELYVGKETDLNGRLSKYLNSISRESYVTTEEADRAYELSYKVKKTLIKALKASRYTVKGNFWGKELKTKNTGDKNSIISAYLDYDKIVVVVLSR